VRVVLLLVVLAIALAIVLPLLRRSSAGLRARQLGHDELVKDPVCQTYVVRSRAVTRGEQDGAPYFCSVECARRWTG